MKCEAEHARIACKKDGFPSPILSITVDKSCTVTARAYRTNFEDSDEARESYKFKVATPVIQPLSGTYTGNIAVRISCETTMASIQYSIRGTSAGPPIGTNYTGPFPVLAPTSGTPITVKVTASARRSGFINSDKASETYTKTT